MAFGTGSQGFGPNTKVYSFNLKDKDLPAPQFDVLTKKEGEEKSTKVSTATRVSGDLIGVRNKTFKHEGKDIISVTATIRDGNEVYFVSIPFTHLGRQIMNSLCALQAFGGIEISVYKGKPKTAGGIGFSNAAVRQGGGDMIYGKTAHADLPPIPKIPVGDQLIANPKAINAFFIKEIEELDKRIKATAPVVANEAAAPESGAPEGKDEDVPF